MFITAVCVLFLIKLRWPKNNGIKKLLNHWLTRWYYFRNIIGYHSNTITC